ncbi:MAG: hypothetical protein ACAH89_07905 [Rariglobus sp.]|nr:hypothetical protein [Rariglobus sp.]
MKSLHTLCALFILAICPTSKAEGPKQTLLEFYIVSETETDGSWHFDSPKFKSLGFIPNTPDLVISKIESVVSGRPTENYSADNTGNMAKEPSSPTLVIRWFAEDAEKFTALTKRATGKRVLIMIAGKPLMAPRVSGEITMQNAEISLGDDQEDQKVIRAAFESLLAKSSK